MISFILKNTKKTDGYHLIHMKNRIRYLIVDESYCPFIVFLSISILDQVSFFILFPTNSLSPSNSSRAVIRLKNISYTPLVIIFLLRSSWISGMVTLSLIRSNRRSTICFGSYSMAFQIYVSYVFCVICPCSKRDIRSLARSDHASESSCIFSPLSG